MRLLIMLLFVSISLQTKTLDSDAFGCVMDINGSFVKKNNEYYYLPTPPYASINFVFGRENIYKDAEASYVFNSFFVSNVKVTILKPKESIFPTIKDSMFISLDTEVGYVYISSSDKVSILKSGLEIYKEDILLFKLSC